MFFFKCKVLIQKHWFCNVLLIWQGSPSQCQKLYAGRMRMAGWPVGKTLAVLQHTQGGSLCRSFAYGELSTMVWPPLEGRPWASKSFWAAKFADGFSPWCFVISHDMPNMFTVHSPQKHRWCWVGAKQCILCTPGSDVPSHLCGPFDHQSFNQGLAKRLLVQVFAVACV